MAAELLSNTQFVRAGDELLFQMPPPLVVAVFVSNAHLLMVGAAEGLGLIPKGTHHWDDFITPEELDALLDEAGLDMGEPRGIGFSPAKGLHLSDDLALNYIVTARAR